MFSLDTSRTVDDESQANYMRIKSRGGKCFFQLAKTGVCHGCRLLNTTFGDLLSRDPRAFGIDMITAAFVQTPQMHYVLRGAIIPGCSAFNL